MHPCQSHANQIETLISLSMHAWHILFHHPASDRFTLHSMKDRPRSLLSCLPSRLDHTCRRLLYAACFPVLRFGATFGSAFGPGACFGAAFAFPSGCALRFGAAAFARCSRLTLSRALGCTYSEVQPARMVHSTQHSSILRSST